MTNCCATDKLYVDICMFKEIMNNHNTLFIIRFSHFIHLWEGMLCWWADLLQSVSLPFFFFFFLPSSRIFNLLIRRKNLFSARHNHETKSQKVTEDVSEQKSMPPAVADTKDTWLYKSFVTSITTFCASACASRCLCVFFCAFLRACVTGIKCYLGLWPLWLL